MPAERRIPFIPLRVVEAVARECGIPRGQLALSLQRNGVKICVETDEFILAWERFERAALAMGYRVRMSAWSFDNWETMTTDYILATGEDVVFGDSE